MPPHLHDVRASPYSAVDQYGDAAGHSRSNGWQRIQRRQRIVRLPAKVSQHNSVLPITSAADEGGLGVGAEICTST